MSTVTLVGLRAGMLKQMLSVAVLLEPCNPVLFDDFHLPETPLCFRDIPEWNKTTVFMMSLGFRRSTTLQHLK